MSEPADGRMTGRGERSASPDAGRRVWDERAEVAREAERRGDSGAAIQAWHEALGSIESPASDPRTADTLRFMGTIHRERGETDRAERRYRESYECAETIGYADGMAQAGNWLGVIAMGRGGLAEAEARFHQARRMAWRGGDERLAGAIEQNLGILANIRGDLDVALTHYRSALTQFRSADDRPMTGLVLNNLGLLYTDIREWEEADAAFDEALQLALSTGNPMLETAVEVNRAELGIARGDLVAAADACQRAHALARQRHDKLREAEALKFLGILAREENRLADAETALAEAAALARHCDDRLLMAEVAREAGELFRRQGRTDEARIALSRALDLFQGLGARIDHLDTEERLLAIAA